MYGFSQTIEVVMACNMSMLKTSRAMNMIIKRRKPSSESLESLKQRNEELISLNRSKEEFVAIASHQLRTPATAVRQYLSLLLDGYADPLTESQKTFIEKAFASNERQLTIIDEILKVTQLDLDKIKLDLRLHDLGKLAENAVTAMSEKFANKEQRIKVELASKPIKSKIDYDQMLIAVENLIENASNYTPIGKKITVRVKETPRKNWISIKDEGVGIHPNDFPKLFQKFSRIHNPLSVEVGGTGLGLYWTTKIVHLHGGYIDVRSRPKHGSTFSVVLPKSAGNSHK